MVSRLDRVLQHAPKLVAAGALLVSALVTADGLPALPLCAFKHTTGLSCPGCGLTRSFCAIGHGQFAQAWHFNPFGFLFYALCVAVLVWPLLSQKRREALARLPIARRAGWMVLGVVAAMWVFGVWRIVAGTAV